VFICVHPWFSFAWIRFRGGLAGQLGAVLA
jgi:hypothetical protein